MRVLVPWIVHLILYSSKKRKEAAQRQATQAAHKANLGKTQSCPQSSTVNYYWVVRTKKTAPLGATT